MNPLHPGHMTAAERLDEVAEILAAWSAREIELQALATLATLAQLHTVCRSFPKISSVLSTKVAADRDRQKSSFTGLLGHLYLLPCADASLIVTPERSGELNSG